MQKFFFISIILTALLSSCIPVYQLYHVQSDELPLEGRYFFENDSLRIDYSFYGSNIPIHIKITNKSDGPILINWAESAAIVNGKVRPYYTNTSKINATIEGSSISNEHSSYFSGNINGYIAAQPHITFLPPKAYVSRRNIVQTNDTFLFPEGPIHNPTINDQERYRDITQEFQRTNSPLVINSYVTVVYPQQGNDVSHRFNHEFYVGKLNYSKKIRPNLEDFNESHRFIDHESGAAGAILAIVAATLLVLLIVHH